MGMYARVRDDERGAGYLAAFIVLIPIVLLAGVGLLIDSSRYFTAFRQADIIAMEAARAGANALDAAAIGSGEIAVDPFAAQAEAAAAAEDFVTATGLSVASVDASGDRVTVVVTGTVNSWFPLVGDRSVTREATAFVSRVP